SSLEKRTVEMFNELLKFKPPQSDKDVLLILTSDFDLKDSACNNDIQFIREIISGQNVTGSTAWPYKGRQPDKAFLYEIVYNNRNMVDAYRWDYLARDCFYLGLKNNFDHLRYMLMARVLEVDGELQICMRDK
ncbi:deoxynucleoside triphosphate triphosphohydrolase SAMHD1, partial [Biomphalaria glabrata]